MSDNIHLIWQMQPSILPHAKRFFEYTAQRMKHDLQKNHPELLKPFVADAKQPRITSFGNQGQ